METSKGKEDPSVAKKKSSDVGNNLRINIKGILASSNTYLGHGNI